MLVRNKMIISAFHKKVMIIIFMFVKNLYQHTPGSLRWLKKSSKEVLSRGGICMRFWDCSTSNWLKISITWPNSEMAHFSKPKTLWWLKFRTEHFEILIESSFEPSQSFRSEKVSHLRVLTRDRDFVPISSWAISKLHAYAFTWQHLLRWLFGLSRIPPRKIYGPE